MIPEVECHVADGNRSRIALPPDRADGREASAAQAGVWTDSLVRVPFVDINKHLEKLRGGDIVGRAVVTFDELRKKVMVA